MTRSISLTACAALVAVPVLLASAPGWAQSRDGGGFLNNLFSRGEPQGGQQGAPQGMPQEGPDASDLSGRMSRIEGALREMTGAVERLQHDNQQLRAQLQRMQDDNEFRFREPDAPRRRWRRNRRLSRHRWRPRRPVSRVAAPTCSIPRSIPTRRARRARSAAALR
jgi:TolA-binding protein